jgi:glycosyltransferase involved in cell wall biosynthesis
MIPRVAHFVFGLKEQDEPFHFLHYVSLESCRRKLEPERIYLHHKWKPWGPWWDRIRRHVTLIEVDLVDEVLAANYLPRRVPTEYQYAHHADFIRLDALIEHGGVYADLDTIFLHPFPEELFEAPFVIGRESPVTDERSGEPRASLCNALLMSEPGAQFARAWRAQMAVWLDGSWSNHSGFLPERLSSELPAQVRVEPEATFFPFAFDRAGLSQLLEQRVPVPAQSLSVHLWAHLWWDRRRWDFSRAHAGWCTPPLVRRARTTLAEIMRPYLLDDVTPAPAGRTKVSRRSSPSTAPPRSWSYLSLDEDSGYGVAARRCIDALEQSGLALEWTPFVPGAGWGLAYEPMPWLGKANTSASVVVAHLVPEYLPLIRRRNPNVVLIGHTVWETDRLPDHWIDCLNSADLVIVPSKFSAEVVTASPVTTPVAIVPHVAPQLPPSDSWAPARADSDTFVFYTIAEWNERKAVFKTVEAYLKAFTGGDPVLLIVKSSHRDHTATGPVVGHAGPGTTAWAVARLIASHPDPPAVRLVTSDLSSSEISALHRRGDCFVSLCRSEGFGLGAFDAAAHGNPVVTTGFGGHLDYLADSPYLVGFKLVPVIDSAGFPSYAPDQRWADPDVEQGAALMREVVADPRRAAAVAGSSAAEIRWQYRPEAIASAFRSAVGEFHHRRPESSTAATVTRC